MGKKIAIFGGKFDPPGMHHLLVSRYLDHLSFDEIIVVPSGPRHDKPEQFVSPTDKITMLHFTFGLYAPRAIVDVFDLLQERFTPTYKLFARFAQDDNELWFVAGSDLIQSGAEWKAKIQSWMNGKEVWNTFNFVVIERAEFPFNEDDIPPNSKILYVGAQGSSTEIRKRIKEGRTIRGLVVPEVERFIKERNLYKFITKAKPW